MADMTNEEALECLKNAREQTRNALAELLLLTPKIFAVRKERLGDYYSNLENCKREIQACEVAIKAIQEINPNIKNVFANSSTKMCHNCDHKDKYIEELEAEIEEYRKIGTPDECRMAIKESA